MENIKVQTTVEARRSFLKKVAYTAPAVMALGALSAPVSAHASTSTLGKAQAQTHQTHQNNGFGNGDQTAPGGSTTTNGAENKPSTSNITKVKKVKKVK